MTTEQLFANTNIIQFIFGVCWKLAFLVCLIDKNSHFDGA